MENKKTLLYLILILSGSVQSQVNLQWVKALGEPTGAGTYDIATDNSGNVYTTGIFWTTTADFDPGPGVYNLDINLDGFGWDAFVSKLDASGNFVWAKRLGGLNIDRGNSISIDTEGNIYTVGDFGDSADFDPGPDTFNLIGNSVGNDNLFLSKLDSSGNFVWAKAIIGAVGRSVTIDEQNNEYVSGYLRGTVDFDPGNGVYNLTSHGDEDSFIIKIDENGNFVWAKAFGGSSSDSGESVIVDSSNVYITGSFFNTVDFNPASGIYNLTSSGWQDAFILKLTKAGVFVWANRLGGSDSDGGKSISVDLKNNVYLTGFFEGTVSFPGTLINDITSAGSDDIFVCKLDSSGTFVWVNKMGGTGYDAGLSLSLDTAGNVYTTGRFSNSVDFDPSSSTDNISSGGDEDVFICKLNKTGGYEWTRTFSGTEKEVGFSITVDRNNNIYSTGYFYGQTNFDTASPFGNLTATYTDAFVCKLCQNPTPPVITVLDSLLSSNYPDGNQWYLNGIQIPGAEEQTYIATTNGTYTVELSNGNCSSLSAPFTISTIIGVDEKQNSPNLIIFPNPISGLLTLQVRNFFDSILDLEITNITGKHLKKVTSPKLIGDFGTIPIDVSTLSNGIYLLKVHNATFDKTLRFIINR